MKWDGPTMLLLLLVAGVGAYVITRPTQSEKNAELLKQIAKLIAAIAILKGKLSKLVPALPVPGPGGSIAPTSIAAAAVAEAADAIADSSEWAGASSGADPYGGPAWESPYASAADVPA